MKYPHGVLVRALLLALMGAPIGAAAAPKDKPPIQYQIPLPTAPDFSAFDWMLGQWAGKTVANNPAGEVQVSVSPDLNKHFLILRGEISLAATDTVPATKESWLGVVSADPGGSGFVLRKYSSTGFMTRYRLTVDPPEMQLNPEGGDSPAPGWLFRETWARTGPAEIKVTVQAAPPGKPFFDYYTAKLTHPAPAEKPAPAPKEPPASKH